jgi:hypothetical protein
MNSPRIDGRRDGICYRCMYGDHKFCYGHGPKTACCCKENLHDLERAKHNMGKFGTPMPLPETPTDQERFYFV